MMKGDHPLPMGMEANITAPLDSVQTSEIELELEPLADARFETR